MLLWDPATRQIVMANAGALPPMICRGGEILKLRVEGVPLGLLDAREYEEVVFQAQPGDAIVLYSDGITDHLNAAGTEYGQGRLAQILRANCAGSAADMVSAPFSATWTSSPPRPSTTRPSSPSRWGPGRRGLPDRAAPSGGAGRRALQSRESSRLFLPLLAAGNLQRIPPSPAFTGLISTKAVMRGGSRSSLTASKGKPR